MHLFGTAIDSNLLEMVAKLILAAVLGALVGYERETHGRPAGLRTHMLVCMGSTIFTIVSTSFAGRSPDPSRVAAQIVTGIGFLGAGTIIRQGNIVRGLTTAASLWTIAGIGMAVGVSWPLAEFAAIAAVVVFITLGVLTKIEHAWLSKRLYQDLTVIMGDEAEQVSQVLAAVTSQGVDILGVRTEAADRPGSRLMRLRLRFGPGVRREQVTQALAAVPTVSSFDWE